MTTKTDITQERADFEAWWEKEGQYCRAVGGEYEKTFAYRAYQAGRAALQSQPQETIAYVTRNEEGDPAMLFFDLKEARLYCNPDEEPEPLVLDQPDASAWLTGLGPIRVGNLPTVNQDEYPDLGGWWVQLRIGNDGGEVLARVYGDTPEQARSRAVALAAPVAQEPVGTAHEAGPMYVLGTTVAVFDAEKVPAGTKLFSAPVATQAQPDYPGATVADRLDAMADDCAPGSQRAADLRAAATVWRKHLAGPAAQPKRRPYNASGSLSEYGIFPECDAAPVATQAQPVVNQQMTTDTALADTQRQIIEAAERRGYERAIAECAQDREDAERYRWAQQFMRLDDVGDDQYSLGLVIDSERLEGCVSDEAARLDYERNQQRWANVKSPDDEPADIPVVTLNDAIDAARAAKGVSHG